MFLCPIFTAFVYFSKLLQAHTPSTVVPELLAPQEVERMAKVIALLHTKYQRRERLEWA
jgi:hypothetical protein